MEVLVLFETVAKILCNKIWYMQNSSEFWVFSPVSMTYSTAEPARLRIGCI